MLPLLNKYLVVGVTGGIAAYKSAELVRRLRQAGAAVQVVMTTAATEFISPLTLQALSGRPVRTTLWDEAAEAAMGHIELARAADAIVIAPASADFIARLAHGFADDLLSAVCLAAEVPIALAPAMNRAMWDNPATQANCRLLQARGIALWGPGRGDQACGETGLGRMLEAEEIIAHIAGLFMPRVLNGIPVVITAGPTQEAIDPMRFISNRSSGRMGFAVAQAAVAAGARVTLIAGPVALAIPAGVTRIDVRTAEEMRTAVHEHSRQCAIFIAAAAVADYRPSDYSALKIKRSATRLNLALEPTADILAEVAALADAPFTVGFAAETDDLEARAKAKLERKCIDMLAANWLGRAGHGVDSETNALHVFWADGERELALTTKEHLARQLIELVAWRYQAKQSVPS